MPISGFLLYGTTQKNKFTRFGAFIALAAYLLLTSSTSTLIFLLFNLCTVGFVSALFYKTKNQIIKSTSLLIYSVLIDIFCFYAFPLFSTGMSLPAYIWTGLMFNLQSALPVIVFATAIEICGHLPVVKKERRLLFENSNC